MCLSLVWFEAKALKWLFNGGCNYEIAELQETIASLKRTLTEQPKKPTEFWVKARGEYLRVTPDKVIRFRRSATMCAYMFLAPTISFRKACPPSSAA